MELLKPIFEARIIVALDLDQHSPSNLDVTEVNRGNTGGEYRRQGAQYRLQDTLVNGSGRIVPQERDLRMNFRIPRDINNPRIIMAAQ